MQTIALLLISELKSVFKTFICSQLEVVSFVWIGGGALLCEFFLHRIEWKSCRRLPWCTWLERAIQRAFERAVVMQKFNGIHETHCFPYLWIKGYTTTSSLKLITLLKNYSTLRCAENVLCCCEFAGHICGGLVTSERSRTKCHEINKSPRKQSRNNINNHNKNKNTKKEQEQPRQNKT